MNYSVVIPAFNAEATLAAAIASVLGQSLPPRRIVVVDDGSTDRTGEIAAGFAASVSLLRQENAGPGAATTRGMAMVETSFVAMLDADDLWLADKAAGQLARLENDPKLDAVFGEMRLFSDTPGDPCQDRVVPGWVRSTVMMRRALFTQAGPMIDPPGRRGEMVDWIARARAIGGRLSHPAGVVALRRVRPGSLSSGRDPARDRGYLHAARAAILRRRAASETRASETRASETRG